VNVTAHRQLTFSQRELFDLGVAWIVLSVAFAIFLVRPAGLLGNPGGAVLLVALSGLTVGVGFLLHELAHKVVAVQFGQLAEFRADYGMLFVAVMSAIVGFIFAAPGAVHHTGHITERQHGLIAVAGPLVNLALVLVFAPLLVFDGYVGLIGEFGVFVNAFLAAFNMLPFGSLDGKTVKRWDLAVFAVVLAVSVILIVGLVRVVGSPI
jgi:Zn-dependent protease